MNRKIGISLIVVSVILAAIALMAGCTARPQASQSVELPPPVPESSSIVRRERLYSGLELIEFRDSAGRICVFVAARNGTGFWGAQPVMDCGFPMRYEDMPEASLKRPL
jgi:hypothetical protein